MLGHRNLRPQHNFILEPLLVLLIIFNAKALLFAVLPSVVEDQKLRAVIGVLKWLVPVQIFHVLQLKRRLEELPIAQDLNLLLRNVLGVQYLTRS